MSRGAATPFAMTLLFVILATAWLLWSGIYKPLVISLGAFSCAVTLLLARQMGFFDHTSELRQVAGRLPRYWWWLLGEILKSSWEVAMIILSRDKPIRPVLVKMPTGTKGELIKTTLGNAITLSPGTVTLDVQEDALLVHCISREGAESLLSGETDRQARILESGP